MSGKISSSKKANRIILYIVTGLITLVIAFPFLWMIVLSFKTNSGIMSSAFSLPEHIFSFDNYKRALKTINLFTMYKNTIIIVILTIIIELVITFMSSFAISRMTFKNERTRNLTYTFLLLGLAIPPLILLFPIYKLTIFFNLYGSYMSLVLPYVATSISFNTLLFTGFLKNVPKEIDEAAIIDGCNLYNLCVKIIVPILKPAVVTVVVFNVLYIWNEFPIATTLINDTAMNTISLGASYFKGLYDVDYSGIVAASVLIIIPQLLFYGVLQRYIIEGMTAGAVKG